MVDGTRMKNFKSHLQQFNSTISDLQARVDSLEIGSNKNYEAIVSMDRRLETMDRKMENSIDGLANRLDGFMLMLSKLSQVSLLLSFLLERDWIHSYLELQLSRAELSFDKLS